MSERISGNPRVGLIGCGRWGMNHARVWQQLGCLQVVADPDPARLDALRQLYPDVKVTPSSDEVLSGSGVDAVIIATPPASHVSLTLQALDAGLDVLVEKPMALSAQEAEAVVGSASRNGSIVMVNHVLEYHPAVTKLGQLIGEGQLGKIFYVYSQRLNLGTVRTDENALWSFAPHDIALLLRLLGDLPAEVSCRGGAYLNQAVADTTLMSLEFANSVQAHVFVSWLHPFKEHRFVVVADREMVVFDDTAPWDEKLVRYPHRIDWVEGRIPVARRADGVPIPVPEREPLVAACQHFIDCVRNRTRPLSDAESGLRVMRVLEAGGRSLALNGAPVRVLERVEDDVSIDPSATVDAGARLGSGTRIWHGAHVMDGATIGRGSVLGQNVFVGRRVRIGDGVKVQNNVSVYEGVELEDHVFCGPSVVFTNVINPRSEIERKDEFRPTLIRRGATLGANSTIVCGVTVGRYAFVGAGAVVTHDVPDFGLVMGVPARLVGWVCRCGERLDPEEEHGTCPACGRAYRRIDDVYLEVEENLRTVGAP